MRLHRNRIATKIEAPASHSHGLQMAQDRPVGKQFRHVYGEKADPTAETPRMRNRIAAVLDELPEYGGAVSNAAHRKFGDLTPWTMGGRWRNLINHWQLEDLLSLVTIAFQAIRQAESDDQYSRYKSTSVATKFLGDIKEVFDEENVHYEVDQLGGIHYKHDQAFREQAAAAIASLQPARYANARVEFERARKEMLKPIPDGKQAIRSVFSAAEGLFKLTFPGQTRLTSEPAQKLIVGVNKLAGHDAIARTAGAKALDSFKDWINAVHNYRHEAGTEEPAQPPLVLAQHLFSAGVAHIRWLAELDRVINEGDGSPDPSRH